MNIFVTNYCPIKCAQFLDNKRVVKMVLESAQMLSTALYISGVEDSRLYKPTHINHPCNIWARQTRRNYLWLYDHFTALLGEYTRRYGRVHKCAMLDNLFLKYANSIPDGELTPHPNCTTHKQVTDTYEAYKLCLQDKWSNDKIKPKWS